MKNINQIREHISEEMDRLRKGESNAAQANAFSNLTGKMFQSIKLELEFSKMLNRQPKLDGMFGSLESRKLIDGKTQKA